MYEVKPRPTAHWTINYLSYVRHFQSQDQSRSTVLANLDRYTPLKPALKRHVEENRLIETFEALGLRIGRHHHRSRGNLHNQTESVNTIGYLKLNIHRDVTWTLCHPILDQLHSLVIPLSDIDRYLESMECLSSLRSVTFKLDELGDPAMADQYMNSASLEKFRSMEKKRLEDLEYAVKFVQIHTSMFKGILTRVSCPNDQSYWGQTQSCPPAYKDRMVDLIPILINPTTITHENWAFFVTKMDQTNLDYVTSIYDENVSYALRHQVMEKPFLHRCRSLRRYNMTSLGPNSFRWAVQSTQPGQASVIVPPLEDISIRATKEPFGSELNDIGQGLGENLKSFDANGFTPPRDTNPTLAPIKIGLGWKTHVLSRLVVDMPYQSLTIDPGLLCCCPKLELLSLVDSRRSYDPLENWTCRPAHLPELTKLRLYGSPGWSFNLSTFHSTKELKHLALGHPRNYHDRPSIPLEETTYVVRPEWTWDWRLPCLDTLDLSVDFAIHFQFRMLQGTPNLRELCLNSFGHTLNVVRVLTMSDFVVEALQEPGLGAVGDDEGSCSEAASSLYSCLQEVGQEHGPLHLQDAGTLYYVFTRLVAARNYLKERASQSRVQVADNWREEHRFIATRGFKTIERYSQHDAWFGLWKSNMPGSGSKGNVDKMVHDIEKLVEGYPKLRPYLDFALTDLPAFKRKQVQEIEDQDRFRKAHPELLAVPSLKKLMIYGRWTISDQVLETMLRRVFPNLESLSEVGCEGYSLDALIRITQAMPWMHSFQALTVIDPSTLSDNNRLRPYDDWPISPCEVETSSRLVYYFYWQNYVRDTEE